MAGAALALLLGSLATPASAATISWSGAVSNDYNDPANWSGGVLPDPAVDIAAFSTVGPQGNTTIGNVTVTLSSTGTQGGTNLGQISFQGFSTNLTLGGGTITLNGALHNNAIVMSSATATQTVASDLVLGMGTGASTYSVVSSGVGGTLVFAGSITGNTTGTTNATFTFGNTSTQNGNYLVTGNITAGTSGGVILGKRGNGTATVTGVNRVNQFYAQEFGTMQVNGGNTTITNANGAGWGGSGNGNATIRVSGGDLNAFDARNLRNSLRVDGGNLVIGGTNVSGGARLSFNGGSTVPYLLNISAGNLTYAPTYGTSNFGVRLGNDSAAGNNGTSSNVTATQTGGTFTVYGVGAVDQTFSLGTGNATAGYSSSYSLSGGLLNVKGSNSTNGRIDIGADISGVNTTTFTLSGNGTLIVEGNGTNAGIYGRQANAGAKQVLALLGGTLVAGKIDATNLRGSALDANGTLLNNGATIAPGNIDRAGRTSITGALSIATGILDVNLAGLTAATSWQDALVAGSFDNLLVTGALTLGGDLRISLLNGFVPSSGDSFTIVTAGSIAGFFANVSDGGTLTTQDGQGQFTVSTSGNSVVLSNYSAVPEPGTIALVAGGLFLLLGRLRRRA